jgi:hypothetical protein
LPSSIELDERTLPSQRPVPFSAPSTPAVPAYNFGFGWQSPGPFPRPFDLELSVVASEENTESLKKRNPRSVITLLKGTGTR